MSNRYRVLLPLRVHTEDGSYEQGEDFEKEFTEDEEAANLASGLLEIVPRTYQVVGTSVVHGTQPGDYFDAALTIGAEKLLLEGGHIQRADKPAKTQAKKEGK